MKNSIFYIVVILLAGELFFCGQSPAMSDEQIKNLIAQLDTREWQAAVDSLAALGESAVEPLVAVVLSKDSALDWSAARACYALAQINTPRAAEVVRQTALDSTAPIHRRRYAIEALGLYHVKEQTALLISLSQDDNPHIAEPAARSLGCLGTAEAVTALANIVKMRPYSISVPEIRLALAGNHMDLVVTASVSSLKTEHYWSWLEVYNGLIELGEAAVPMLLQHVDHPDLLTRLRIIRILGYIGSQEAQAHLLKQLEDTNWMIRNEAAVALFRMNAQQVNEPLQKLLQDQSIAYAHDDIAWLLHQYETQLIDE